MNHTAQKNNYQYASHGALRRCDLCGNERLCNEGDELVACQECQRELLPAGWAFY